MCRDLRARSLAWALIALALPRAAQAASSAGTSVSDTTSEQGPSAAAPLDLVVNGAVHDPIEVVLRNGDALVAVEDLEAAGLRGLAGKREIVDGRVRVSLASLAPSLAYEVDEVSLALRVTATREVLAGGVVDLRPAARPPGLEARGDASGFLNYSVQRRTDDTTSGFFEAGASQGGRLLYSSGQLLQDGRAVRGVTNLTLDDVGSLRRLVVGDTFATSTGLGGGVQLGGLSLVREYGLDPYFIRSPLPRLSGFAAAPSTVDVYVNGVLARQVPVAPGSYDLTNLPVTAGAGNVQTVLRDPFGRTEVLDWNYYFTAGLLARGLSDYGYSVGFRRLDYGRESNSYGRPVVVSRHRVGLLDHLTVGGRLDAATDLVSAGSSATIGLPFGSLDLEAAASAHRGEAGGAGSAAYSFVSRRWNAGGLLRLMSSGYAHAALGANEDRARFQTSAFVTASIWPGVSTGLSWSLLDRRDTGRSDVLTARTDVAVARSVTLGLSGSRTHDDGLSTGYDVFASLTWALARRSVADVSVQSRPGGSSTVLAGVQRGLPAGTGVGFRARANPGGESTTGVLQAQWDHGRYELRYDRRGDAQTGTATIAGGVVLVGERLFLTRPVDQGYALIRVGVADVRGYAEGQEIGRTDRRGDLFVPRLLPYYGNRLGIADQDVPVEYQIGASETYAAPTFRGGIVTRFGVTPLRATEGELVVATTSGDAPPAYGELRLRAGADAFSSPIGGDGRFYLESVPPGTHRGEAEWSGGRCRVTLVVPESPPIADVGQVRCDPEEPPFLEARPAREALPSAVKVPAAAEAAPTTTTSASATATATPTATPSDPAIATLTPALPATSETAVAPLTPSRPIPPPRGFGPRTPRCPSCTVCLSAALHRLATPSAHSRCVNDLTVMRPSLGRAAAVRMCLATPDWDELCDECVRMRNLRRCPTWPSERDARRPPRPLPGRPWGPDAGRGERWPWSPLPGFAGLGL